MRLSWIAPLRRAAWPLLAALAVALATALAVTATRAADIVPLHPVHAGAAAEPGRVAEHAPATAPNPQVAQLDQQIKAMRDDYHSQLDPLQAQLKALREKFDPQIQALVDQRWTLVEQGKSPDLQQLDTQEKSDLASLADREKSEIEGVRQKYAEQRKELQQKYADQRKGLSSHH